MSRVRLTAPQPPAGPIGIEGLHLIADEVGIRFGLGSSGHADPDLAGFAAALGVCAPVETVAADQIEFQFVEDIRGHQLQPLLEYVQSQLAPGDAARAAVADLAISDETVLVSDGAFEGLGARRSSRALCLYLVFADLGKPHLLKIGHHIGRKIVFRVVDLIADLLRASRLSDHTAGLRHLGDEEGSVLRRLHNGEPKCPRPGTSFLPGSAK